MPDTSVCIKPVKVKWLEMSEWYADFLLTLESSLE